MTDRANHAVVIARLRSFLDDHAGRCGGLEYVLMWLERGDTDAARAYCDKVDPDKVMFYPLEVRRCLKEQGLWTFPDNELDTAN